MTAKKYSTNKTTGTFIGVLIILQLSIAISSRPLSQLNPAIILVALAMLFVCIAMVFGVYVSLDAGVLVRIDTFFFKQKISVRDIDVVRYQPSYGIGKEISSLYVFGRNSNVASITMTNIWFSEKTLSKLLNDLKKINPLITLDQKAEVLMKKYN